MPPLKLAIVGAGPSSFYVASRLLSLLPPSSSHYDSLRIHMYDRLWAPHGLVRYGVAPDHPEVKNCTHKFDAAATDPRFRFYGNINITASADASGFPHSLNIPLSNILPHYTHLLLASGCTRPTPHPLIPFSSRVLPALSLVHWYTSHPAAHDKLPPPLHKTPHVTVIGNGNVALDIARMLLSKPERLATYDVPASVLDILTRSQVRHVSVVGRRGPAQAAFTAKELREMMNLEGTAFVPLAEDIIKDAESRPLERQHKRILDILKKGSKESFGDTERTWSLDFFRSPTGLTQASDTTTDLPLSLNLAHTTISPTGSAVPTGMHSDLQTSLVVAALGHTAEPTTPWYDRDSGHIRTSAGHVLAESGEVLRNVYASGWAGRGAKGVLATTMMDAYGVAETILRDTFPTDFKGEAPQAISDAQLVTELLRNEVSMEDTPVEIMRGIESGEVTTYEDWRVVDAEEVRRGEQIGKERERMAWVEAKAFLRQKSS